MRPGATIELELERPIPNDWFAPGLLLGAVLALGIVLLRPPSSRPHL